MMDVLIWGGGATFDNVILRNSYKTAKMNAPCPWLYRNDRCFRTLCNLFPQIIWAQDDDTSIAHHALHDARSQAQHAVKILKYMSDIEGATINDVRKANGKEPILNEIQA